MSGVRYESCPVRGCPDNGWDAETAVCNDCGGCTARHCRCKSDPNAVVGGGMNLLRKILPPGSTPKQHQAALFALGLTHSTEPSRSVVCDWIGLPVEYGARYLYCGRTAGTLRVARSGRGLCPDHFGLVRDAYDGDFESWDMDVFDYWDAVDQ